MMSQCGVKVCIRARPLIPREAGLETHWEVDTHQVKYKNSKEKVKCYTFDRVFSDDEETSDVYEEIVEPIVQSAMQGFNGTIFAYGQTASGKTHTMLGSPKSPGVIPLAIDEIFSIIQKTPEREFLLRMSYLEIYNENLKDLLAEESATLSIREDEFKNVKVSGLIEKMVSSPFDVHRYMEKGEKIRHMASTNMNDRSSRSHTICRVVIESRERIDTDRSVNREGYESAVKVAQLNLVDLAGSERAGQTGAEGQRFKEGCYINKSLMVLGQVINQICKDNEVGGGSVFISFRDSKLTRILQPSLGGNSLTAIICTVTLAVVDETESTLRFANSAKNIKNKPIINEVLSDEALLFKQKREINKLRKKIEEMEKQQEQSEITRSQKHEYEEKIQTLTRMLLVSTQPVDYVKKQQKMRRETWCPGAASAKLCKPHVSPMQETFTEPSGQFTSIDHSMFLHDLFTDERSRLESGTPVSHASNHRKRDIETSSVHHTTKRRRLDEAGTSNAAISEQLISVQEQLKTKEKLLKEAQEINTKLTEEQVLACEYKAKLETLETELDAAKDELQRNQSEQLQAQIRKLTGEIKMQDSLIEQFISEQNSEELEKKALTSKVDELSSKVVELERRELSRIKGDSAASALQGQVKDLSNQLRDTCREKRQLQEQLDAETDRSRELSSTVEKLTTDLSNIKEKSAHEVEEYKHKMSSLQTQLEVTLSSTESPTSLEKHDGEIVTLKENLTKKDNTISQLQEFINSLQTKLSEAQSERTEKEQPGHGVTLKDGEATNYTVRTESLLKELDGTQCFEEALKHCELLMAEKEGIKKEMDEMVFKLLEKEEEITKLKEQAKFDHDEKEILFEEEKRLAVEMEKLERLIKTKENENLEIKQTHDVEIRKLKDQDASKDGNEVIKKLQDDVAIYEKTARDAETLLHDSNRDLSKAQSEVDELKETVKQSAAKVEKLEELMKIKENENLEINQRYDDETRKLKDQDVSEDESEVIKKLQEEVTIYEKTVKDAETLLHDSNRDLSKAQSEVVELKEAVKRLTAELERVDGLMKTKENENIEIKQRYDDEIKKLKDHPASKDQNEVIKKLQGDVTIYEKTAKDAETLLHDSNRDLSKAQSEVDELKETVEKQKAVISKLESDVESYMWMNEVSSGKSDKHQLERSMDHVVESPQSKGDGHGKKIRELEELLTKTQQELIQKENSLKSLEQRNEILSEDVSLHQSENNALRSDFNESKADNQALSSRVAQLKSEYESTTELLKKELQSANEQLEDLRQKINVQCEKLNTSCQTAEDEKDENASMDLSTSCYKNEIELLNERLREEQASFQQLQTALDSMKNEKGENSSQAHEAEHLLENLASSRKEISELQAENESLKEEVLRAHAALLAENNKELDQLKLIEKAGQDKKDSIETFAQERELANREIKKLSQVVEEKQTALAKSLSDKDIAVHQANKLQQQYNEAVSQISELRNALDGKQQSTMLSMQGHCDSQKLEKKIKQLSLNLDLTQQKFAKSEEVNKQLQGENRKLESDRMKTLDLLSSSQSLQNDLKLKESQVEELQRKLKKQEAWFQEQAEDFQKKKQLLEGEKISQTHVQEQLKELQEEVDVLNLEKRRNMKEQYSLQESFAKREENFKLLTQQSEEMCAQLQSLKSEVEDLTVTINQQKSTINEHQKETENLLNSKFFLEQQLKSKSDQLGEAQLDIQSSDALIGSLKAKISDFEAVLNDDKAEQIRLLEEQQHLSDVEKNFVILYHNFTELSQKYEVLQKAPFNSSMQKIQDDRETPGVTYQCTDDKEKASDTVNEIEEPQYDPSRSSDATVTQLHNETGQGEDDGHQYIQSELKSVQAAYAEAVEQKEVLLAENNDLKDELERKIKNLERMSGIDEKTCDACLVANSDLVAAQQKIEFLSEQLKSQEEPGLISSDSDRPIDESTTDPTALDKDMQLKEVTEKNVILEEKLMQAISKLEEKVNDVQQLQESCSKLGAELLELQTVETKTDAESNADEMVQVSAELAELKVSHLQQCKLNEELAENLKNSSDKIQFLEAECQQVEEEKSDCKNEISQLRREFTEYRMTIEKRVDEQLKALAGKEDKIQTLEKYVDEAQCRIKDFDSDLATAIEDSKADIALQTQQNTEMYQEALQKATTSAAHQQKRIGELESLVNSCQDKIKEDEEKIEELKSSVAETNDNCLLNEANVELKQKLEVSLNKLKSIENKLEKLEQENHDLLAVKKSISEDLNSWKKRSRAKQERVEELEQMVREDEEESKLLEGKIKNLEKAIEQKSESIRCDGSNNELKENLQVSLHKIKCLEDELDKLRQEHKKVLEAKPLGSQENETNKELKDKLKVYSQHVKSFQVALKKVKQENHDLLASKDSLQKKLDLWIERSKVRKERVEELEELVREDEEESKTLKENIKKLEKALTEKDKVADGDEKEKRVIELQESLKSTRQDYEKKISSLKEQLKANEGRMYRLKEQLRIQVAQHNDSIPQPSSRMTTRSAGRYGGFVEKTQFELRELEMIKIQQKNSYLEKELAKYMDIEVKRKSENQALLDKYNKLKRQRMGAERSRDVLVDKSQNAPPPIPDEAEKQQTIDQSPDKVSDTCKTQ